MATSETQHTYEVTVLNRRADEAETTIPCPAPAVILMGQIKPFGVKKGREQPITEPRWWMERVLEKNENEYAAKPRSVYPHWEEDYALYLDHAERGAAGLALASARQDEAAWEKAMDFAHLPARLEMAQGVVENRLTLEAGNYRNLLVAGSGLPGTTRARTASDAIEAEIRRGAIRIRRSEDHSGALDAYRTAIVAVESVTMNDVAPVIRARGDSENLPQGRTPKRLPTVRRQNPPYKAAEIEAWTEGDRTDEVSLEVTAISNRRLVAAGPIHTQDGSARVRLNWRVHAPDEDVTVHLRASNQAGRSRTAVTLPRPTRTR